MAHAEVNNLQREIGNNRGSFADTLAMTQINPGGAEKGDAQDYWASF